MVAHIYVDTKMKQVDLRHSCKLSELSVGGKKEVSVIASRFCMSKQLPESTVTVSILNGLQRPIC